MKRKTKRLIVKLTGEVALILGAVIAYIFFVVPAYQNGKVNDQKPWMHPQ